MLKKILVGILLAAVVLLDIFLLRTVSVIASNVIIVLFAVGASFEMWRVNKISVKSRSEFAQTEDGSAQIKSETVKLEKGDYKDFNLYVLLLSPIVNFVLFTFLGDVGIIITLLVAAVCMLSYFTFAIRPLEELIANLSVLVYPQLFIGLFYAINSNLTYGLLADFLFLAIAIFTDNGAMFMGMLFKGKKLCPRISPKKTVSGAIGGLFWGTVGALLTFLLFSYLRLFESVNNAGAFLLADAMWKEILIYASIGILGAAADQIGDLCASAVKRRVGIKDYGKLIPGHGGVMDRLDGMSFVLVVVYIAMRIIFA